MGSAYHLTASHYIDAVAHPLDAATREVVDGLCCFRTRGCGYGGGDIVLVEGKADCRGAETDWCVPISLETIEPQPLHVATFVCSVEVEADSLSSHLQGIYALRSCDGGECSNEVACDG